MTKARALGAMIVVAAVFSAAANADGPSWPTAPVKTAAPAAPVELRIALDQARALALPVPATGVVIGNPAIAGVSVQSDRLLFVTGRSYGTTNLIVVGSSGRPVYQGRITVVADESGAVMMNKGGWTVRYDCAPECRRRPDISEDPQAFSQTQGQIGARAQAGN